MSGTDRTEVVILGATGSIGQSTLDVIGRHPQRYRVHTLAARSQWQRMLELCQRHRPRLAIMDQEPAAEALHKAITAAGLDTEVQCGSEAMCAAAARAEVNVVVAAIVGAAGLLSTLAAARASKRILLANKEALVMSGGLFMDTVRQYGAELLPVDSEHNAIFQCLPVGAGDDIARAGVNRILLTASGGPFRDLPLSKLADVTPEQACNHPNWDMGRKISVDSATMMNKGLEVIEACWLFNAPVERIQVVIHPQSVIHSMVQYNDGSVLAELGNPDMRTPIANALSWPERIVSGVDNLDIFAVARLDFSEPDLQRFPCLRLAMEAAGSGGTAQAVLNAANEVAVAAFLDGRIAFTDIARVVEKTLDVCGNSEANTLEIILAADQLAREQSRAIIGSN